MIITGYRKKISLLSDIVISDVQYSISETEAEADIKSHSKTENVKKFGSG